MSNLFKAIMDILVSLITFKQISRNYSGVFIVNLVFDSWDEWKRFYLTTEAIARRYFIE